MAGIIAPETPDDPSVYAPNGYSRVDRTWMEGFHAQVTESFNTTAIGPQLWREVDRQMDDTSSPLLTPEQANEQYGIADVLSFDKPINAEHAAERQRLVQDQMRRQSIVDRSGLGTIGRLSASLIGGAADPVNIAFAVAPETLLARVGGLGRGAALSLGERVAFGAASGSLGNAVLTPAQAYFAGQEGRQYGIGEALADITLGAAIGGAFPVLGAGLSRANKWYLADADRIVSAIENAAPAKVMTASPDTQLEALATVLQQKMQGMPADVSPVLNTVETAAHARRMEFAEWFDGSKVVDKNGAPQRVFHGTMRAFDEFDTGRLGDATGGKSSQEAFFFTNVPGLASGYATPRNWEQAAARPGLLNRVTGGRLGGVDYPSGPNVRPSYLSMKNPKIVDGTNDTLLFPSAEIRKARAEGYDGVILRDTSGSPRSLRAPNGEPPTVYVPFDTKQIRSTFDPGAQIADPTALGPSNAGETFRAGEQMPQKFDFQPVQQPHVTGDPAALQDLAAMQQLVDEAPPVPRSARDEGQVLGQGTAATRELEQFAAQDEAVLQALRDQGRLTAADEAQFEQVAELEKQYKELADARSRAVTCFMMEGNG